MGQPLPRASSVARARTVIPPAKRPEGSYPSPARVKRTCRTPQSPDRNDRVLDAIKEKRRLFGCGSPPTDGYTGICTEHLERPNFSCVACVGNLVDTLIWWPARRWASLPVLLCGHAYGAQHQDCHFCLHLHKGINNKGNKSSNYIGSLMWNVSHAWYGRRGAGVPAEVTTLLRELHRALVGRQVGLEFLSLTYHGYRPAPTLKDRVTDENLPRLVRRDYQDWALYCQGCNLRAGDGELFLAVCPRCW